MVWQSRPGAWDPLQARRLYPGEPEHGIPALLPVELPDPIPRAFTSWPARKRRPASAGLHFFTDDYRFEPVWKNPDRYAPALRHVPLILSPDFSIFAEMPPAMVAWQVYRARWLARALQEGGAAIVPAVTWGGPSSFPIAFLGLREGDPVAVTAIGRTRARAAWDAGYRALMEAMRPRLVFCLGELPAELRASAPALEIPSDTLRRLRATSVAG